MNRFHSCEFAQLDKDDDSASPLLMRTSDNLRLDWWTKTETDRKQIVDIGTSKTLMTWSGSQKRPRIFRLFQESLAQLDPEDPLNHAIAVCDPFASNPDRAISPFYFDSRRDGNSQDIGFSPDEQSMSVFAYPAVELLALIGIQRFRPAIHEDLATIVCLHCLDRTTFANHRGNRGTRSHSHSIKCAFPFYKAVARRRIPVHVFPRKARKEQ